MIEVGDPISGSGLHNEEEPHKGPGSWITPNSEFSRVLSAAAKQTEGETLHLDPAATKDLLIHRIRKTDFGHIRKELAPFLINPQEIEYFRADYMLGAVEKAFAGPAA